MEIRTYKGLPFTEIAHLFGVSATTVQRIIERKAWGWL